jgi:hypothetical protein
MRHNLLSQLFFQNLTDLQAGNPVEHSHGAEQNAKVINDTNSEDHHCDNTTFYIKDRTREKSARREETNNMLSPIPNNR